MHAIDGVITYILLFLALYFEVFLLITYLEVREMRSKKVATILKEADLKTVTIIVPCWNEENTIIKTIHSLLELNYPKEKLSIFVVDDGSTDGTWKVLQKFKNNKQITLFTKPNGGKHDAVNFALERVTSELVGCLDADSFVHPEALRRIVDHFENPENMAVTPSIKVYNSNTVIELIQKVEYGWAILLRQMLAHLDALYVTPGPFSIFRMEVFKKLGGYKRAYNTEDMEMALRMQTHKYRIGNAHDAIVYTVTPNTLKKLYKQRLRWTYGFLKNVLDYKHLFFRPQYGHLGIFILPTASLSLFSLLYLVVSKIVSFLQTTWNKIDHFRTVGFYYEWQGFSFDWFFVDTNIISLVGLSALVGTIVLLFISRKMSEGSMKPGRDIVYFLALYSLIAPLWISKAIFNVVFARQTKWR